MDAGTEEKLKRLERALEKGQVRIHLDPRRPGVLVPASFRADYQLILKISYRFDPPDLSVNEWGVRETLSFNGARFAVAVPWSAIYAITGLDREDEACMYPDDMPRELFEAAAQHFGLTGDEVERLRDEARDVKRPVVAKVAAAPARGLRVVPSSPSDPAVEGAAAPASGGPAESEAVRPLEGVRGPTPVPVPVPTPEPEPEAAAEPPAGEDRPSEPERPKRGHLKLVT